MSCCHEETENKTKPDLLLYGTLAIIIAACVIHFIPAQIPYLTDFSDAVFSLLKTVWWGIALGLVAVGLMNKVPREYFNAILGRGDTFGGLIRAAMAGLLLDLCSHGILMVGAKLYERGASLAQIMTFLIASPWNSITLTLILVALIGLPWTLVFIAGSVVIAIVTGMIYMALVKRGILPDNPNKIETIDENFDLKADAKARLKGFRPSFKFCKETIMEGWHDGKMVMRWLFLGLILASLISAFVSTDMMIQYFGPTMIGLLLTLLATTIIEVCSEGSTPIGAELVNRAGAPGNGFTFLMAGVATDYTEMMVIKQFTGRWLIAFSLPLITVPQIVLLGWIMNNL